MGRIPKVEKERALEAKAKEDDFKTENKHLINTFVNHAQESQACLPQNGMGRFPPSNDQANTQSEENSMFDVSPQRDINKMVNNMSDQLMSPDGSSDTHRNFQQPNFKFPGQSPLGDFIERSSAAASSVHCINQSPSTTTNTPMDRFRFPPPQVGIGASLQHHQQHGLPPFRPHMPNMPLRGVNPLAPPPPPSSGLHPHVPFEPTSPVVPQQRQIYPPSSTSRIDHPATSQSAYLGGGSGVAAGGEAANWNESMRRLSPDEGRGGGGSDSGYSNEGCDPPPVHPSPAAANDNGSSKVDNGGALGGAVQNNDSVVALPDMQIPRQVASRLWLDKDKPLDMNMSHETGQNGNIAGFQSGLQQSGHLDNHTHRNVPTLQRSMSESSVTFKLAQLNTRRDSLQSPERSHSENPPNPTPPRTPDPFGPTVLRELFHQVFRSPDRIDSMQNRLKDLIREVPPDQYQKLVMTFLEEATKHMPTSPSSALPSPSASGIGLRRSLDGPISNEDIIAAKRMRQAFNNANNGSGGISNGMDPFSSPLLPGMGTSSCPNAEGVHIKEENVSNDNLYGHINANQLQATQAFTTPSPMGGGFNGSNQNGGGPGGIQIKTEVDTPPPHSSSANNATTSSVYASPDGQCSTAASAEFINTVEEPDGTFHGVIFAILII